MGIDLAREILVGRTPVPHGYATAFLTEAKRRGAADAGRATGDDHHCPAEAGDDHALISTGRGDTETNLGVFSVSSCLMAR